MADAETGAAAGHADRRDRHGADAPARRRARPRRGRAGRRVDRRRCTRPTSPTRAKMNSSPSGSSPISTPDSTTTPTTASSQRDRVAPRAGERGGDGDRADELDDHALAEGEAIDRQVEEQVHQRSGDAEDAPRPPARRRVQLALMPRRVTRPAARLRRRCTRNHATVAGATSSNSDDGDDRAGVLGDAETTNSASGENRCEERRRRARSLGRVDAGSVEQVGIGAADLLPQRLEAEPAGERVARLCRACTRPSRAG